MGTPTKRDSNEDSNGSPSYEETRREKVGRKEGSKEARNHPEAEGRRCRFFGREEDEWLWWDDPVRWQLVLKHDVMMIFVSVTGDGHVEKLCETLVVCVR